MHNTHSNALHCSSSISFCRYQIDFFSFFPPHKLYIFHVPFFLRVFSASGICNVDRRKYLLKLFEFRFFSLSLFYLNESICLFRFQTLCEENNTFFNENFTVRKFAILGTQTNYNKLFRCAAAVVLKKDDSLT